MGFTWTETGALAFDYVSGAFNYYESFVNPSEGSTISLAATRYGNRLVQMKCFLIIQIWYSGLLYLYSLYVFINHRSVVLQGLLFCLYHLGFMVNTYQYILH